LNDGVGGFQEFEAGLARLWVLVTVKWAGYWGTKLSPYNFWQTELNHFLAEITQVTTRKIQIRNW
jgi:hypothetical protein